VTDKITRGPLTVEEAVDIVSQVAAGLSEAHEAGMVHRDIKPANILVTDKGIAKILDFGLAKLAGHTRVTKTGTTVGTVSYMSPEQAAGEEVEASSDVFSLGVVLYELLAGKLPFRGDHEAAVIYSIMNVDPEPVERPDLPAALQNVIDKALTKDSALRYQNAGELVRDLETIRAGGDVGAIRRRRLRVSMRTVMTGALGAIVLVAAYLLFTQLRPQVMDQPSVSPDVIAVFPFTVRGSEDVAYMGEGMVDLLSMKLDGVGGLRSVDPGALLGLVKQDGGGNALDPQRCRTIAERAGAGLYVAGSIVEAGGDLSMRASVFETTGDAQTHAEVEGVASRYLDLVDELAADLVADRAAASGEPMALLAEQTTTSFEALKAYLEGERLYRSGLLEQSVEACKRAVAADSTFALAYYRMECADMTGAAPDAIENAMRYRYRLPENERRLIEAHDLAWKQRDPEGAIRLLRTNVSRRADDIESRLALGGILFYYGKPQNLFLDEAKAHFERVLHYSPDHWDPISYLHWLTGLQGDFEECRHWAERRLELEGVGIFGPLVRAGLAFAGSDTTRQAEVLAELEHENENWMWMIVTNVAGIHGNVEGGAKIARIMTDPARQPRTREQGHRFLAALAVVRGRWEEADTNLIEAESYGESIAPSWRAELAIAHPAGLPLSVFEVSLKKLSERFPHSPFRSYYVGLVSARLGEFPDALRHASELDSMALAVESQDSVMDSLQVIFIGNLARTVRAEVAWLQGHQDSALAEIERTHPGVYWFLTNAAPFPGEIYSRYLRAFLFEKAGRLEEALRWYGSLGQGSGEGFIYFATKHFGMGRVYERMGNKEKAEKHYARFVELWHDCDPQFQATVDDVRQRIARLEN
jgi:tetratricopeptide (TPR) repeat protein